MADVKKNDPLMELMGKFLYKADKKATLSDYKSLDAKDTRTNIFAKSYAESLKNTFKGLSDAKIRMFRGGLNKKVLDKSEEIKAKCDELIKNDKGLEALGLMYGVLEYDSADKGFKDMVDAVKKEEKPAEPEKPKAEETGRKRRKKRAEKAPEGEGAKTTKEEKPPKTDEKKEAPKEAGKKDEKKESSTPAAPAEDAETKGVGPAAPKAPTAPPEKAPQAGLFASKKEATKFLNNFDHTLANINANEFEVIDATYTRYKRFMGSKYEVKFEEDVAMDENKFREIVTDTDQSSVSVVGDNRTGKPWVHIKISIPEPPEVKKDEKGNYLEYKVKRKDEYGRSFSDMKWVRGMGFMPCNTGKVFKEITTTKICRKYLDGDNAGKVVVKVEKEEVK